MRRVVVTGLGLVAPTGNTVQEGWENALQARTGVGPITRFDASSLPVRIAAEVKGFDHTPYMDAKEANRTSRFVALAAGAAHQAIRDSGLDVGGDNERFGVSIGVGLGALDEIEKAAYTLRDSGPRRVSPFFIPYAIPNMASGFVSIAHRLRGPNLCTATACASGTHAVGEAFLTVAKGDADMMLAGGAESAMCALAVVSFHAMRALSTNNADPRSASRPFDRERDGFVLGEGAGVLVLEEFEHARRRGARIYAELVGYGRSGDAYHLTAPAPDGEGAIRCMKMAVDAGGIALDEVDYINAHGTSTKMNDAVESKAIAALFGQHAAAISISSTKGVTGHCLGAAGGIEAVYATLAVHHALVPPTAGLATDDPECTLDYTPRCPRERAIRHALSNSFGFGGPNGCLAFKKI